MYQVLGCVAVADDLVPTSVPSEMLEAVLNGIGDDELSTLHAEPLSGTFTTEEEAWYHASLWVGDYQMLTEDRDWQGCEYDADMEALRFVRVVNTEA